MTMAGAQPPLNPIRLFYQWPKQVEAMGHSVRRSVPLVGHMVADVTSRLVSHDYKEYPKLAGRIHFSEPPQGYIIPVIYSCLPIRVLQAFERGKKHNDYREIGDVFRRDIPTLTIFLFALNPVMNKLMLPFLEFARKIRIIPDNGRELAKNPWEKLVKILDAPRPMGHHTLEQSYYLNNHQNLVQILRDDLNRSHVHEIAENVMGRFRDATGTGHGGGLMREPVFGFGADLDRFKGLLQQTGTNVQQAKQQVAELLEHFKEPSLEDVKAHAPEFLQDFMAREGVADSAALGDDLKKALLTEFRDEQKQLVENHLWNRFQTEGLSSYQKMSLKPELLEKLEPVLQKVEQSAQGAFGHFEENLVTKLKLKNYDAKAFLSNYAKWTRNPADAIAFAIILVLLGWFPVFVNKLLSEKSFYEGDATTGDTRQAQPAAARGLQPGAVVGNNNQLSKQPNNQSGVPAAPAALGLSSPVWLPPAQRPAAAIPQPMPQGLLTTTASVSASTPVLNPPGLFALSSGVANMGPVGNSLFPVGSGSPFQIRS
ncbi:MAG: hypothetical protein SFZ03_08880 [Candidatus Melainabacteria bacterium]|nr:hypothetical protein [Candidatus Melainabacteria bacterium]